MSRLTNKDDRGKYYTVEEKILIANEPVNPTTTWITNNENRRYGSPIEKLGKLEDLEDKLGCPLDVFVKLLFEQKIWIEVNGKMYLTETIDFSIELELQEDETWINTLEDYGEAEFWAWYVYNRNYTDHYTDHLVLRLKDYKKTWWLRKDKSE